MLFTLNNNYFDSKVTIVTNNDTTDDVITLKIVGDDYDMSELRRELNDVSGGIYGHIFDIDDTTNLDLSYALKTLPSFSLISVEPELTVNSLNEDLKT